MKRLHLVFMLLAFSTPLLSAQSTLFFVRHAEKAEGGNAKDPDLSVAGHARAEALVAILKDSGITEIYATEFKRTQQTAEPLARASGIKTTVVPAKETETLVARLKETKGNALIVGHSNTVAEVLKTLGAATPAEIGEADYDNLFALVRGSPVTLLRLHYR